MSSPFALRQSVVVTDDFELTRVQTPPEIFACLGIQHPSEEIVDRARKKLLRLVDVYLDRGPGLLVLTGLSTDATDAANTVGLVSSLLGTMLPQNREGTLVRAVRDRGKQIGECERARYSDSRFGGNLHTDGAEASLPAPDVFALFCVQQSRQGGSLQFVHVRDVLSALQARPEMIDVLRSPFHFDRRGDQNDGESPTVTKPILFRQRGRDAISYLRSYVERGHEHSDVPPLTQRQRESLDALDAVLDSKNYQREGKLREGELALFDNLSLVHGRTEFQDDPDRPRLLLRTWIRLDSRTGSEEVTA